MASRTSTAKSSTEDVVRRYLAYLADPTSAIDHDAVADIQQQLAGCEDPIDRLRLESELDRARSTDGEAIAQEFIGKAKEFAEAQAITAEAFRRQGVPAEVLALAGFDVKTPKASKGGNTPRAARVNAATVASHMQGRAGNWSLKDIEAATGASVGTVRKVVDELVAAKKVKALGPDPDHASRGRAPNLFSAA
ncbi:MAG: hypothetical protein R2754_14005 [Microthrixaceae bacterium]